MSIASRITSIEEHITNAYTSMDNLGIDISSTNKNIYNISTLLDTFYESLPKVNGKGSNLSLSPTKVGKIKLNEIQGDTLQNGTPTPDTPVSIQSVTGNQNVVISNSDSSNTYEVNLGKNLLDISTLQVGYVNSSGQIYSGTTENGEMYSSFIKVKPNTTYTFKIFETSSSYSNWFGVGEYSSKDFSSFIVRDTMTTATQNYISITTRATTQYIVVSARNLAQATKIQLEKGSSSTSYSPYFTPIELNKIGDYEDSIKKSTGKQLFDKDSIANGYVNADGTLSSDNAYRTSDFIPVKSNTAYYKTSTLSPRTKFFDINKEPLNTTTYQDVSIGGSAGTFTTPENACYFRFSFPITGSSAVNIDEIMIQEGSTALPYEPYGKVWYKTYNSGEKTFNGSETWETQWNGDNIHGWRTTIPNLKQTTEGNQSSYVISDYYETRTQDENFSTGSYGISNRKNQSQIIIKNNDILNQNDFKTWLGTHNVKVKYVLATPIYEVITNEELINQLESLYNAKSKNGTTNINVTSEDLAMILNVGVLKGDA